MLGGRTSGGPRPWRARSFEETLAVSPVISTILMVAITVVLAATAFVLIADVGGHSTEPAPSVGATLDDELDTLQITTADPKADWNRIWVRLMEDQGTGRIFVGTDAAGGFMNEPATAGEGEIALHQSITASEDSVPMKGGDYLEFCRESSGTDGAVRINIVDFVSNVVVKELSFNGIDSEGC